MRVSDLARRADVTEGAIRQMESGQTKQASFPVGVRLARILCVSPDYLAGISDDPGTATETSAPNEGNDLEGRIVHLERYAKVHQGAIDNLVREHTLHGYPETFAKGIASIFEQIEELRRVQSQQQIDLHAVAVKTDEALQLAQSAQGAPISHATPSDPS